MDLAIPLDLTKQKDRKILSDLHKKLCPGFCMATAYCSRKVLENVAKNDLYGLTTDMKPIEASVLLHEVSQNIIKLI